MIEKSVRFGKDRGMLQVFIRQCVFRVFTVNKTPA